MLTPTEMIVQTTAEEEQYQFTRLSREDIWDLGCILKEVSAGYEKTLAIEIDMNGTNIFRYLPEGRNGANILWLERKRKTVQAFEKSSLRVYAEMAAMGETLLSSQKLEPSVYADCGGGFPIRMRNGGCVVGFIGVSGLPHYLDHEALVKGLEKFFASHPQD